MQKNKHITNKLSNHFPLLLSLCIAVNTIGLFLDIMEPDGALYASIAKNIVEKNDWVNLFGSGGEWLDKPHLPFWLSAITIKLFGANAFAYKLPSFLCFLLSIAYTFKITVKTCSKETAEIATLIYASALHILLCNFDVRAEIYITCFTLAATYHLLVAPDIKWFRHIILASVFTSLAIMTKGIFVFITIGSGFVVYWVLTKQYKQFIAIKWYLYIGCSLLFIFPELYSLYQQFDAHPEKIVFGKTGVSGIQFFFWDSQFGRFFNTGPIQGSGDFSFFFHTTLWAFLPWSIFLILAIWFNIKKGKQFAASTKTILYSSALCSFLLFSFSKFQLPHYIVIIFPYLAILVANYFRCNAKVAVIKIFKTITLIQQLLVVALIAIISVYFKFDKYWMLIILVMVCTQLFLYFKSNTLYHITVRTLLTSCTMALFLNLFFYSSLLPYQAGMMAGKWQKNNGLINTKIAQLNCNEYSFDYYGNSFIEKFGSIYNCLEGKNETIILTPKNNLRNINQDSFSISILQSFSYFHITELSFDFINNETRANQLDSLTIAKVIRLK
jgi:4-amino-4-deoxy-L-arabinose transferase-like glycosyltransferase